MIEPQYIADLLAIAEQLASPIHIIGERQVFARRSISTSYYAMFHFLSWEIGNRVVGEGTELTARRATFERTLSHAGIKSALEKISKPAVDGAVSEFLLPAPQTDRPANVPVFARTMALTFLDLQTKRHDADYNWQADIHPDWPMRIILQATRAIAAWQAAQSPEDCDFKRALCLLMVLKGQLRAS